MKSIWKSVCVACVFAVTLAGAPGCSIRLRRYEGDRPPLREAQVEALVDRILATMKQGESENPFAVLVSGRRGGEEPARQRRGAIRTLAGDKGDYSKGGIGRLLDEGIAALTDEVLDALLEERATRCAVLLLDRLDEIAVTDIPRWVSTACKLDAEMTRTRLVELIVDGSVDGERRLAAVRSAAGLDAPDAVEVLVAAVARCEGVVQEEIFAQLEAVAGTGIGSSAAGWQRWWRANREKPPQQWLRSRIEELEAQLEGQRARSEGIVSDLSALTREALKEVATDRNDKLLSAALVVDVPEVRSFAARQVGRLGMVSLAEQLTPLVEDEEAPVRQAAIWALGELSSTGEGMVEERVSAARTKIAAALRSDENAKVRATAAEALGRIGRKQSIPGLLEALEDADGSVRGKAIEGLAALAATEAAPIMIEMLWEDENREIREALAKALGELGDRAAAPHLGELLWGGRRDENVRVRWAAADALGSLGDPASVETLELALADGDGRVRQAAVIALERLGSEEALAALARNLAAEDGELAGSVWKALKSAALREPREAISWAKRLEKAGWSEKARELAGAVSERTLSGEEASFELLRDLAMLAKDLGMNAEARAGAEAALAKRQDDPEVWRAYLGSLVALGELAEAWEEYGRYAEAVEGAREEVLAGRVGVVEAALDAGEREQALAFWRTLLESEGAKLSESSRERITERIAAPATQSK